MNGLLDRRRAALAVFFALVPLHSAWAAATAAADSVLSVSIKKADGSSGQTLTTGSGVKTGHIQDGAVTDAKIAGPISTTKLMVGTTAGTVAAGDHNHDATNVCSSTGTCKVGLNMPHLTIAGPIPEYNFDPTFIVTREIWVASEGLRIYGDGDNGGFLHYYKYPAYDATPGSTIPSVVRMHTNDANGAEMWGGDIYYRIIDLNVPSAALGFTVNTWDDGLPRLEVSAAGVSIGVYEGDGNPMPGAISGSYRGTLTTTLPAIPANSCVNSSITLARAAVGAECVVGMPATAAPGLTWGCFVQAQDQVVLRTCNASTVVANPASATYSVRVFNPPLPGNVPQPNNGYMPPVRPK